MVEARAA
jgi:hypothetical protein